MTIQQQGPNNINWTNYLYSQCDAAVLNNIIFPYGSLEILLQKTSPPTNNSEICQVLTDVTNPQQRRLRVLDTKASFTADFLFLNPKVPACANAQCENPHGGLASK